MTKYKKGIKSTTGTLLNHCLILEEEINQLKEQLAIIEKAFLNMAKQLLLVYDEEYCIYGDEIAGYADTPEEAVENYIKQTKESMK